MRAFYYTALVEDQEYSPIRPLIDWLDYNGYTMVTKPTKEFTDAAGRRKIKGNMDIELAVDVMEMAERLDHIVLFSGDGDFRRLVEAVQRKGVRVTVVSTVRSQPPMVADELRRQADNLHRAAGHRAGDQPRPRRARARRRPGPTSTTTTRTPSNRPELALAILSLAAHPSRPRCAQHLRMKRSIAGQDGLHAEVRAKRASKHARRFCELRP